MNKLVKGSVAAATGIVLLMGGAGSLALWNDSADISNASIDSGNLTLSTAGGAWDTLPTNWVPGDEYEYTANVTVTATGDNILATLTLDNSSITGDAELLADTDIVFTIGGVLPAGITGGAGSYEVTTEGVYVLPVTVTVTFDSASGNLTQDQSIDLTDIGFLLEQHL